MTPFARRIAGGLLAGSLLALTACGGGSGDGTGAAGNDLTSMLGLVPADIESSLMTISLFDRAVEIADLDIAGEPGEEEYEADRVIGLTGSTGAPITVMPSMLLGTHRSPGDLDGRLFPPSAIRAEITVGDPPSQIIVGVGDDLERSLLDDAEATDGVERRDLDGTSIVSWLDDNQMDVGSAGLLGPNRNQAGRIAIPRDGVLVHTSNDAAMTAALDAVADGPTLADDDRLTAVTRALDDLDVVTAHLTTIPVTLVPDLDATELPSPGDGLAPYDALGIGGTVVDGEARMVIVLHHADPAAAMSNAEALEAAITEGVDAQTGRPWSEILTDPEVGVDDGIVTVTATSSHPRLWSDLLMHRASLLAVG